MGFFDFLTKRGAPPKGWSGVSSDLLTGERFPPAWVKMEPAGEKDIAALAKFQGRKKAWFDSHSIVGKSNPTYTTQKREFKRKNPRFKRVLFFLGGRRRG